MTHRNWDPDCKVYIGGLRDDANRYDIEDTFRKIGKVKDVWVARKPPGFAFVEMEDPRDAQDAVRELDGSRMCGARVKVEIGEVEVEEMIGDLLVEGMIEEVVEEEGREVAPGAEAVTGKGEVQAIGA